MKLTTKLLLGATLVAGLSVSGFAACATDVDFGSTDGTNGKNITGLKNPTEAQHAATKAYVDGKTDVKGVEPLVCDNTEQSRAFGTGPFEIRAHHVSLLGHKHNNAVINGLKIGSTGYIHLDANTSASAAAYNLYIAPPSQSPGNFVYRCGSPSDFKIIFK